MNLDRPCVVEIHDCIFFLSERAYIWVLFSFSIFSVFDGTKKKKDTTSTVIDGGNIAASFRNTDTQKPVYVFGVSCPRLSFECVCVIIAYVHNMLRLDDVQVGVLTLAKATMENPELMKTQLVL